MPAAFIRNVSVLPYYKGQTLALVEHFANPLSTLLILPKPDDKIL